ncbi:MAG: tetratricopeptide repeat protein, partial [Chitinivibrionales bacterium]|nr:tetratricopeptide repeat protein [Chitinivibrionales bacterium]
TFPVGMKESWGFSCFGENAGNVDQYYTDPATGNPVALNSTVSNSNNLFMFSYANNLWKRLSLGVNLNVSYQTNFSARLDSGIINLGADAGLSYRLLSSTQLGEHLVGVLFQNILAPASFAQSGYANTVKASWVAHFGQRQVEAGADVDFKNLYRALAIEGNPRTVEYAFSARLGAWLLRFLKVYFQAGSDYVGFAGGVNYPRINQGRDFSILYQYMILTDAADASSHSVYLRAELGQGRAKNVEQELNPTPNDLYNRACKLYFGGKYWDAYFVFGRILAAFPTFFKNDYVEYYRGSCLEKLDMRELSADKYKAMKQNYARSVMAPHADLGLMRLYYRDGLVYDVQKQFALLSRTGVPDSLKHHAEYLMGQTYLQQKSFWQASELFSKIPPNHPDYLFALHSLAICYFAPGNTAKAQEVLNLCINAKALTSAQEEIRNRSLLFAGYLYYEQKSLAKAITALREVPKSSYYYEDALLGECWTALQARQWSDCINYGHTLQNESHKASIQCEGAMIEAYGWWMLRNPDQGLTVLQNIRPKADSLFVPLRDSLDREHERYHQDRSAYALLAAAADGQSLIAHPSTTPAPLDSLHNVQRQYQEKLARFYVYADEFDRRSFFSRNIQTIKTDIDYLAATIQKASQQPAGAVRQLQEKQKTIDSEIGKLKQQIESIDKGNK